MSNAPKRPATRKPAVSDTLDFASLVASKTQKEDGRFTIDMSRLWPEKAELLKVRAEEAGEEWKGLLFTYRPLRLNQMFALEELIVYVQRQRPLWTGKQCLEVAGLSACHIDPPARIGATDAENRTMLVPLYCQTFDDAQGSDEDTLVFYQILEEFNTKSGGFLKNLQALVEEKKKDLSLPKESENSELSTSA